MKSKIGLMAVVLASSLLLAACTNKQTTNADTSANGNQVQQGEGSPSGTPQGRAQGQQQMDLAAAAETLGVTEDALREALGMEEMANVTPGAETTSGARSTGQPKQMDLAAAAETLGVTEDALREALGMDNMPSGEPQQNGNGPQGTAPTN